MNTTPLCPSCGKPLAPDAPKGLCQECLLKAGFPTGTDTGGKSSRFVPPTVEELIPNFPQLEILEFIGQGGMGAVYKARQKQLDRIVALKILPPQVASGPGFAERFTREARALAKLNHPHIVTLYEFGQTDGLFYFLMEFVDGINLRQLLNARRIAPKEALAIVPQICDALQFAHERGIVHRDIKPENILLSKEGQVKIADFGVAKIVAQDLGEKTETIPCSQSGELTEAGSVLGTPQYMAPEQVAHPLEVDHRADIYSLGVVFYQMLTGELPTGKFEPPSKKVVIDVRLDEVVLRALEKAPELRYQQVSEVKTMVETIATTPAGKAAAAAAEFNPWQPVVVFLAMVVCIVLFIIGFALPFPANTMALVIAPIGIIVAGLKLAGLWPFGSPLFPQSNFTRRSLPGNKPPGATSEEYSTDKNKHTKGEHMNNKYIVAAIVALFFAGLSGVLGAVTFCFWPNPSVFLVMSIPVAALLGIFIGISAHTHRLAKRSIVIGSVNLSIWLIILVAVNFLTEKSDYIGKSSFPHGDSIEISSVSRTRGQLVVRGRYNLVSTDRAQLALYITTFENVSVPTDPRQLMEIANGRGVFELIDPNLRYPGLPHMTMYSMDTNGTPNTSFATVYFGTKAEATKEAKINWLPH